MHSTARKTPSKPANERRRRWRALIRRLVEAQPGASFHARCKAAARKLGVSHRTVSNYAGGPDGSTPRPMLPPPDELADVCAAAGWNVAHVLYGPPHPEHALEAAPRGELAEQLAAHLRGALAVAQRDGRLPPVPPPLAYGELVHDGYEVRGERALEWAAAAAVEEARAVTDYYHSVRELEAASAVLGRLWAWGGLLVMEAEGRPTRVIADPEHTRQVQGAAGRYGQALHTVADHAGARSYVVPRFADPNAPPVGEHETVERVRLRLPSAGGGPVEWGPAEPGGGRRQTVEQAAELARWGAVLSGITARE